MTPSSCTMAKTAKRFAPDEPAVNKEPLGWKPIAFLLSAATYIVFFFFATDLRRVMLWYAPTPDSLVAEWFGNDLSRFGVLDRVPLLLLAGLIFVTAFLCGRLLLDALRVDGTLTKLECAVFSLGIGLNLLSLVTLAFGLAGQLRGRWWFGCVALGATLLSAIRWRRWRKEGVSVEPGERSQADSGHRLVRAATIAALPFAVLILLGGMVRPWYFDVREYHLQIPKEWYQQGYIGFVPHNFYGNMPLGAEMHALLGMVLFSGPDAWWWGAMVGKTVIAAMAPLTALAIYAFGRRYLSRPAAAVGSLAFLSTPWVAHVSMTGMIDGASAFYFILALHASLLLSEQRRSAPSRSPRARGFAALAGFLAGSAVACKYPAVLFLVAPLFLGVALLPLGKIHAWEAVVFLMATLAGCGLWLGKNWWFSGNPAYPLLYEWFDGATRTAEKDAQLLRAHGPPHDSGGRSFTLAQLLDSLSIVLWRSDFASAFVVPFAIWGFWVHRRNMAIVALGGLCAYAFAMWWLTTHRVDRFLLPALPWAALLAGAGATWSSAPLWRRVVFALLAVCLVVNFLFDANRFVSDNRYFVAFRDLRIDAPAEKDPVYNQVNFPIRYLNRTVRAGYCVLAVGEAQVFDFEVPVLYNTCFDDCVFEQLMRGRTGDEQYAALRAKRISHIFFSWRELDRYRSPGNYGYSAYATRNLVRDVLAGRQGLLRRVPLPIEPEDGEIFEVVGWEKW
jgi:hypothetical protein